VLVDEDLYLCSDVTLSTKHRLCFVPVSSFSLLSFIASHSFLLLVYERVCRLLSSILHNVTDVIYKERKKIYNAIPVMSHEVM
jgi:hypothetical protein